MDTNLDIDRISLEDRIKRLEGRLPGSGGGSGGHTDFLLDPKIVDQCPENAITDVGNGWVFYLSIPNFYDLTSRGLGGQTQYPGKCLNNLELKIARFYPRIGGSPINCMSEIIRVRTKATLTNLPATRMSFGMELDIPFNDTSIRDFLFNAYPDASQFNLVSPIGYTTFNVYMFDTTNPTTNVGKILLSMHLYYYLKKVPTNYSFYCNIGTPTTWNAIQPSCSWGYGSSVPFTTLPTSGSQGLVGQQLANPIHFGECTRRQPSDLPQELRHMYPNSWYA